MKAIFWDLDDTLLNTLPARMRALSHAYQTCLGSTTDPVALWRSHRGGTLELLGERLLGADGGRFTRAYRDHYYGIRGLATPYDGIREVLEGSAALGLRHAVVTSKLAWVATEELSEAGLLEFFEAVVGSDDTERHKPDPEPIHAAMDRLCVHNPEAIMFVGDSPADVWAARNAGCTSIAALWGTLDAELVMDAGPALQADEPRELLEILRAACL